MLFIEFAFGKQGGKRAPEGEGGERGMKRAENA